VIAWWWLIVALLAGALAGVFLASLCVASHDADVCEVCLWRRHHETGWASTNHTPCGCMFAERADGE
jgi:hypothetical protein